MNSFNSAGYDLNSLSGRINALLDLSGNYPPVNYGRSKQVGLEFNVAKSTANNWLVHDQVPSRKQLRGIVETTLIKMGNSSWSAEEVQAWIEYNLACPFTQSGSQKISQPILSHRQAGKVYLAIHKAGLNLGQPDVITALPSDSMNFLTETISENADAMGERFEKFVTTLVQRELLNCNIKITSGNATAHAT